MTAGAIGSRQVFPTWVSSIGLRVHEWLHRRSQRSLRLCETLPLGEKRFVAVVQFEQLRYLVGGTSGSITLLSQLPDASCQHRSRETASQKEAPCEV